MASSKVTKTLFSLSETDKELQSLVVQRREVEEKRAALLNELALAKERAELLEGKYKESASRKALEEHRLRDEEQKILERRKQLTALGGAKSAKLMERELEIATRVLQTMEQSAVQTNQEVERLEAALADAKDRVEELEKESESLTQQAEESLNELEKNISKLDSSREKHLEKLELRLKNLYRKVSSRYQGEAIAICRDGACRSCFRALPAQMYNQVLAGNMLLQCPGCSRILVHADGAEN